MVWGFDPIYFVDEDRLTRDHLDRASMDRPIFVFHASAHLATVNTAMLERHDITRESPTVGIARDSDGEPNGELQEMPAIVLASSAMHMLLQPSSSISLPSSHISTPSCRTPSPHTAVVHALVQSSPSVGLPSSHSSEPS